MATAAQPSSLNAKEFKMDKTLAILKPDCVARRLCGQALAFIESHGFKILALKMIRLERREAEAFYAIHTGKPFFTDLINFMTSGPCVPLVLQKESAVDAFRQVIGATDPARADEGTLRRLLAENVQRNIVHGSDSAENAKKEIAFFFPTVEIIT